MSADVVQLASEVTPYVTAAASAYGGAVLARVQDQVTEGTADAAVGFGRRLAQRIFGTHAEDDEARDGQVVEAEVVPEVLADVIDDPDDQDNQAALRKAIRKALAADAGLAAEVAELLAQAQGAGVQVMTFGDRSPAVGTNHGIIATGDDNTFTR
ncbi:hypothetical protein [Actinomadura macrotermitis]|uniref:Uncharacterized protein n=1 Tax=Actinomadura macrotermitis TaxID=2585200 RepID=A0A7K0BTV7_9ACTN|nr:hypothetical protein [Actinomadura macrotermitis]MQY04620.1 hypothetical protein [Actinomadura macrotermitis]